MHAIFQLAPEPKTVQQDTERVSRILNASYEKANLVEVVKKHFCHLSKDRHEEILKLLLQFEGFFYKKFMRLPSRRNWKDYVK